MSLQSNMDLGDPEFLQKRIIRFAVLGIILTALIIGFSTALPLFLYGKKDSEKALEYNVSTQAMTIRELFSRYQDIAIQVTTRTKAREQLSAFNNNQINLQSFQNSISPILSDAMRLSVDIAGITRVAIKGNSKVGVGVSVPEKLWRSLEWDMKSPYLSSPVQVNGKSYFLVLASINTREKEFLGFDVIAFRMGRVEELIKKFSLTNTVGELDVGWKKNTDHGFISGVTLKGDASYFNTLSDAVDSSLLGGTGLIIKENVVAYAPVEGFNWAALITVSKNKLYGEAIKENLIVVGSILLIILLGIWGLNILVRPLAGKILIRSDELKKEVDQKTYELKKVNRALHALSAGNEVIVRVKSEQALLDQICEIVVTVAGYKMAWVGVALNDENKTVIPVAQSGFDDGYLEKLSVSWADNKLGQGPTGKAIRLRETFVADIASDETYGPWRDRAKKRGYSSSIALPLINEGNSFGALNIYSEEGNTFEESEKRFLIELAHDLSYGISMLRAKEAHEKTLEEMRKLSLAVEQADNIVVMTNEHGVVEYVNPEFEKVTGYRKSEVLGYSMNILKSGQHSKHFYETLWSTIQKGDSFFEVFTNRKKSGEFYYEEKTISPIKNIEGVVTNYISTGKDITERVKDRQRIEFMAYHDNLTQLPNRELFRDRLEHALAQAHRKGSLVAVMFLDLDRFKQVNDSLGHMVGDLLLKAAADRLSGAIREGDTVARIGGDEFTVICEDCNSHDDVKIIAQHITESLSRPFNINNNEIYATASIGIAIAPDDASNSEELITAADTAMYKAKIEGRNNYQFYTADLSSKVQSRVRLESELRRALKSNEFELYYQPRVNLETDEVCCVEVLLRWNHPDKGVILPDDFVPILEETNLIVEVTEFVLRTCCQQLNQWNDSPFSNIQLAINLSVNLFRQGKILEMSNTIAKECNASVSNVELEITENLLMEDIDTCVSILHELKNKGFQITIDDFGTGYSSMSYLKRLPIDCVKIDRSFVKDVYFNKGDEAIVNAVTSLAHSLGLKVTAEGIESQEQLDFLRKQGCDEGQGYLFSRPLPVKEFEKWMATWQETA